MIMQYKTINFNDINQFPKNKTQLIEVASLKLKKLEAIEGQEKIAESLNKAITWLKNDAIILDELENNNYYRLCFHEEEKELVFNVQVWDKYNENVDIQNKVVVSNSECDLDNDEDTIIIK